MTSRDLGITQRLPDPDAGSLLNTAAYDDDAASVQSRSDQDTDSDDDALQRHARNSRELAAHDRILLMEEEETDKLVTQSRRGKDDLNQDNAVSKAAKLFRRPSQTGSIRPATREPSLDDAAAYDEKRRQQRRSRRQLKKDRLVKDAQNGEDGALMYEMEAGALKEGSDTGESSDREDSDDIDRRQLLVVAEARDQRRRDFWWRILIYGLIVVGFTLLTLGAWILSVKNRNLRPSAQILLSNGSAIFGPTTIIISLDGFRADFLQRGITPRLNAFIKEGVSPKYMLPSFPSVTFPNHYTLATGLYPESHGVVGNSFWDPDLKDEFFYTNPARSLDPKWWGGEPFWVTAEEQGIRTAIHMWPGSEAHIMGVEPSFVDKYNGKESLPNKVSRIFEFIDMPGHEDPSIDTTTARPRIVAAYVPNVDSDGHKYGPNSTEIQDTIRGVDDMLEAIFSGLEERNLTNIVNVIVVSDHGMATTDTSRLMQIEDFVDMSLIEHNDGWPLFGLRPRNETDTQRIYDTLVEKSRGNPNLEVYLRDVNMPERYHFSNNDRIAPLWVVPKAGWAIVKADEMVVADALRAGDVYHPRGLHGYDFEHPLMRAIFVARGPAFPHPPNSQVDVFQNINVYNILCDSVGMTPKSNNGTLRLPFRPVGYHQPGEQGGIPEDPVPSDAHATSTTSDGNSVAQQAKPTDTATTDPSSSSSSNDDDTKPVADTDTDADTDADADADSEESRIAAAESMIKGFWEWAKEKAKSVWESISGSK